MLSSLIAYIPHGHCYLWQTPLVSLHVIADAMIAVAYFSIPAMLIYFVSQRQDVPFSSLFVLFGIFIIACGLTHLLGIWTLWQPDYWLSGGMKLFTGFVSVYTAATLYPIIPQALELPSPEALETMNAELAQEVQERTTAEAEVRRLNQELEARVIERTQALEQSRHNLEKALQELTQTQSQIIQAEKMSSLGQLVAGVAHEINNPANFIKGNIQPIQSYANDLLQLLAAYEEITPTPSDDIVQLYAEIDLPFLKEDLFKALNSMGIGIQRIKSIVESLRTFSRLDEADLKTVDIHQGIESSLLILNNRLHRTGDQPAIKIMRDYGDLAPVHCYPSELNQVFMHLISNSIDAIRNLSSETQPEITITTCQRDNQQIDITITDNGQGIPSELHNKIFDPFFTTKPIGQGRGLGLAVSYQIITDRHQGTLAIDPQYEQGTKFLISIPVNLSQVSKASQKPNALS